MVAKFIATRAADRALGGDGSGNATNLPTDPGSIDFVKLIEAQNKVLDPNSDEFQFNSSKKLAEELVLFPVVYSQREIIISAGVGGVTLLPRSEDPLADIEKLAQFISESVPVSESRFSSVSPDLGEKFENNLTREELAALGDLLESVQLPPTILNSNTVRELYKIETIVTVVDGVNFGETVSDFDLDIQEEITRQITEKLTPPDPDPTTTITTDDTDTGTTFGGVPVSSSDCLLLQHIAANTDIPAIDTPSPPTRSNPGNPGGTGGFSQSGQCLFCSALLPLNPTIKIQLPTAVVTFFNSVDWVPQIKKRLVDGHTLAEIIEEIDIIDKETPFGASQLYDAMSAAALAAAGEEFKNQKKVFYIVSDNSESFSLITRDQAIDDINAVDGDGKSPVVYTVFSTSFPVTLSAQLERNETSDIQKITEATGGRSATLINAGFMDQVLNLTIGGATGGLGWGQYVNTIDLGELSAITEVTTNFVLPSNTEGFLRFRYSADGFNFSDFSEKFEGSQTVDFADFSARIIEFEITLTTGFTTDVAEEYDASPTGIPKLINLVWGTSIEREDFIFLNSEDVLTNAQQVAAAFEGTIPIGNSVEIGVASSASHDWRDFQNSTRPVLEEFGKTFLLDRTKSTGSVVPSENLTTRDGLLYKTVYGSWDPTSSFSLFSVVDNVETPIFSGFRAFPRTGEIYFNDRQASDKVFRLAIINDDVLRVGLRLRNKLHNDNITLTGVGFMYSTNDVKPAELSQVAPRAINVFVNPQTPNALSTFVATYTFVDLNGDKESGTIITWLKNGTKLRELQDKVSWTNDVLLANNKLKPNDKILFSVTPSDGVDFGSTIFSPAVTIVAQPPTAANITIIAIRNGLTNDRFDTASTLKLNYDFLVDDAGDAAKEKDTLIRWFVDGILFKEGTFSDGDVPQADQAFIKDLTPAEVSDGTSAHEIGNEVTVEVTPKTILIEGTKITTSAISIVNSLPIATDVLLTPINPTADSTLQLSFTIDDPDILSDSSTQTDQTEIRWFVSTDEGPFIQDTGLDDNLNVPPFFLSAGQQWKAEISPFDGLDLGPKVTTSIARILPA